MDIPTVHKDRDLKFYIWLLTYNRYPHEKIRQYENNEQVEKFDGYDTYDNEELLYKEDPIHKEPKVKVRKPFEFAPVPMFLFCPSKILRGKDPKIVLEKPSGKPIQINQVHPPFFWIPEKKKVKVKPVPRTVVAPVKHEEDRIEFSESPMYLYNDNTVIRGQVDDSPKLKPKGIPVQNEQINEIYIYQKIEKPKHTERVEPELKSHSHSNQSYSHSKISHHSEKREYVKTVPIVVSEPIELSEKELPYSGDRSSVEQVNDSPIEIQELNISPHSYPYFEDPDFTCILLPPVPVKAERFQPLEDSTPLLIPHKHKEHSRSNSPRKHELAPDLLKSYKESTEKMNRKRLMKIDDAYDQDDVFVIADKKKNKDHPQCNCQMCVFNTSKIRIPSRYKGLKNPRSINRNLAPEEQQRLKMQSRINKLPKASRHKKKHDDPYKNRETSKIKPPSQPNIKPDFSASMTKFFKRNVEDHKINMDSIEERNLKYMESIDPTETLGSRPESRTSLDVHDNLDRYLESQSRK